MRAAAKSRPLIRSPGQAVKAGVRGLRFQEKRHEPYSVRNETVVRRVSKETGVSLERARTLLRGFDKILIDFKRHYEIPAPEKRLQRTRTSVMRRYRLSEEQAALFLRALGYTMDKRGKFRL